MGLGGAALGAVALGRGAALQREVLPLLPSLRSAPELLGLSFAHALTRTAAPQLWARATAVVLACALLAVVGPPQLLALLPVGPLRLCRRLAPALLRRKLFSALARLCLPTLWREVAVLGRIVPLLCTYAVTGLRVRVLGLGGAQAAAAWDRTHVWATPRIRSLLDDFGGFLRKISQMLGTATPSVPRALISSFAESMDNCAGLPWRQVRRIIERELGRPLDAIFVELDETPAATASIAQVHFGRLRADGSEVAVKVACVGSKAKMLSDMRTMLRAAIFLRRLRLDGGLDLPALMRAYWDIVPDEFDLTIEARKMRAQKNGFDAAGLSDRIGMARPRDGLCSTRVLVMDRLRGTRMLDVMRAARDVPRGSLPCPPAVARVHGGWAGLVHSLHLAWGQQVLVAGVFHSDPHPGNMLLLDDGRLGILDWGQTKRLRPEHVTLLCRIAVAMAAERYAQIESLIESSGEFELEALQGRSPLEKRMAWVLICYTFVDTRWTPLSQINLADAPNTGLLGQNRLAKNSQEAFPLIRAVFLLRGVMASLGVSSSMAVAWEPMARRALLSRGIAVEPMGLVVVRRATLRPFWLGMRWMAAMLSCAHDVLYGKRRGAKGGVSRELKALEAVSA